MSLVRTGRRAASALTAATLLGALAACGTGGTEQTSGSSDTANLTVLAASSLTDVFRVVGAAYEKEHPGTKLTYSFAGSQELAAQVKQGAPADVLVTADTRTMDGMRADTGTATVIARNRLVIAVGAGNPKKIEGLENLADSEVKVVLAAPEVPVGRYSRQVLADRNTTVKPVSEEPNARAVLSKVELGEADAGIVYKTDAATAAGKTDAITIPDDQNAIASYPAATLKESQHSTAATAFVKWLSSPQAQQMLRSAGFEKP